MADILTTSTNSALLVSEYLFKNALKVFHANLHLYDLGLKAPLPEENGKTVRWVTYSKLSAATTPLTESVTPAGTTLTTTSVSGTIASYGNHATISDVLSATSVNPVEKSASELLGEQGALTVDTLIRDVCDANFSQQYANGKANLAATGANDLATAKELLKAVVTFKKNNVPAHSKNSYVAVLHPACMGDIMNDTNIGSWVDINKYTGSEPMMNGEMGKVFGCRVLESSNISSTTSGTLGSATVYSNLIVGKEPFGVVELGSKGVQLIRKPPIDPLNQISTIGWKILGFVTKYLGNLDTNPHRGIALRSGSAY